MFPSVRSADAPNAAGLQKRYDYDGSNNMIYEGWASPGALSSQARWAIVKYSLVGSNTVLSQYPTITGPEMTAIWDNRAALAYS